MVTNQLSSAMEDYLKAIYHLAEDEGAVSTVLLAGRMGVAAPSVTSMVKRLTAMNLVLHTPYRGIELTRAGRAVALEVVRHHRLIEAYLAEFLDVPWENIHDEAERLEHVLSEELEQRMAEKLGEPNFDPHGHPIPTHEGSVSRAATLALWDIPPGHVVTVAEVSDRDPSLLAHLRSLGLVPGSPVEVIDVSLFSGTQTLRSDGIPRIIGSELARTIRVNRAFESGARQ